MEDLIIIFQLGTYDRCIKNKKSLFLFWLKNIFIQRISIINLDLNFVNITFNLCRGEILDIFLFFNLWAISFIHV